MASPDPHTWAAHPATCCSHSAWRPRGSDRRVRVSWFDSIWSDLNPVSNRYRVGLHALFRAPHGRARLRPPSFSDGRLRGRLGIAGRGAGRGRGNHRNHQRQFGRQRARRVGDRDRSADEPPANRRLDRQRRLHGTEPPSGRVPRRCRARRLQTCAPERNPPDHGRKSPARPGTHTRQRERAGNRHQRCPDAEDRDRRPRNGHRERAAGATAPERTVVHHPHLDRAGCSVAAQLAASPHQRRPAQDERVPVRWHFRSAARAGAGGLSSGDRRDSGIQNREQQPAGGVRPLQRRRHQPDHQVGDQPVRRKHL